jgi:hypothetical protein
MYKHKNKIRLEKSGRPLLWIKRKLILIMTAFMLGMSNGMDMEDRTIKGNHYQTEQQDKKD